MGGFSRSGLGGKLKDMISIKSVWLNLLLITMPSILIRIPCVKLCGTLRLRDWCGVVGLWQGTFPIFVDFSERHSGRC